MHRRTVRRRPLSHRTFRRRPSSSRRHRRRPFILLRVRQCHPPSSPNTSSVLKMVRLLRELCEPRESAARPTRPRCQLGREKQSRQTEHGSASLSAACPTVSGPSRTQGAPASLPTMPSTSKTTLLSPSQLVREKTAPTTSLTNKQAMFRPTCRVQKHLPFRVALYFVRSLKFLTLFARATIIPRATSMPLGLLIPNIMTMSTQCGISRSYVDS